MSTYTGKSWTRDEIAAYLNPCELSGAAHETMQELIAERDWLAARLAGHVCTPAPAPVAYQLRMPDGALYDVHVMESDPEPDGTALVHLADDDDQHAMRVTKAWLVEVRPPSIDDPEPLPLTVRDPDGGVFTVDLPRIDGRVCVLTNTGPTRGVDPTVGQAERVARAIWQAAQRARAAGGAR